MMKPKLQRWRKLRKLEDALETPMIILGFIWLGLLILEFTLGIPLVLERVSQLIWIIFIIDFLTELTIAPKKFPYLKKNWLTVLSLGVPALRVFRLLRITRLVRLARMGRGLRLLRVVSSFNRGMNALKQSLGKKGFGYAVALTLIVNLLGAAGMLAFEKDVNDPSGIHDYGTALWWTSMILTTMGSQYWPQTTEGRMLALLLAIYSFAVFGYITATVASFFVGREAEEASALDSTQNVLRSELEGLRQQVALLTEEIRRISAGK